MAGILSLVVPALIPAVADGIRGVFGRITGGAASIPQSVDERIKLMAAENERLKAGKLCVTVSKLDAPVIRGGKTFTHQGAIGDTERRTCPAATPGAAFRGKGPISPGVVVVVGVVPHCDRLQLSGVIQWQGTDRSPTGLRQ